MTTSSLPLDATAPRSAGDDAEIEPAVGKKGGFWGGGKKADKRVDEGIAWHMRTSRLTDDWSGVHKGLGFEQFWEALAERHCEQEVRVVGPHGRGGLLILRVGTICTNSGEHRAVTKR